MKLDNQLEYICPEHGDFLSLSADKSEYLCEQGCNYQVVGEIPRFVPDENYASSFGLQWNKFRQTQLDSYTGLSISRERLSRIAGGSLDLFRDKYVLEAGCGAGRFTEILLDAGAKVLAVDISSAVEANYQNFSELPNHSICQADLLKVPIAPESCDIVLCIGVIQHTPDPEETISKLCSYVKPGGLLLIDHYSLEYPTTLSRRIFRFWLKSSSTKHSYKIVVRLVKFLWPIHHFVHNFSHISILNKIRSLWIKLSPVVDYAESYPQLGDELLLEWAILDTHDTLTDHYKHLRSIEEIETHLANCGMELIETKYAGNGVEARARKPL